MFDVGFSEVILLAFLGLLILGPERLPAVARTLGGWVRRGQRMAREFQQELEKEVDLQSIRDLKKDLDEASSPLKEAARTLDEGHSILNKKLSSEWHEPHGTDKALSHDVPAADQATATADAATQKPTKTTDG